MRSLDILSPMRPKAEAGRAPAGEDPRAGGAPDFEAMLDACERGTAPAGEASAELAEAGADESPPRPAEASIATVASASDPTGSALQALMALSGPAAAPAAAHPDASLEAMVQRAAIRAGSGPSPTPPAPALPMSVVGLETHFAPVGPHAAALSTNSATGPVASGALPSPATPASVALAANDSPSNEPAPDPVTPGERSAGPNGYAPSDARAMPRGTVRDPAAALAAPASADRPPTPLAANPAPAGAASPEVRGFAASAVSPAPPSSPESAQSQASGAAGSAAAQTTLPDALRSAASRGRTAPRGERSEQVAAAVSAPALSDLSTAGDLPESGAVAQSGPTGEIQRDPEPARARPAGIARPETATERAASMPQVKADAEAGATTAGADRSAEAPRPEMPPAEPVLHATASAPAPVPSAPLRQIVDAVAAQLPAATAGAQARLFSAPIEAGPLKILTLQLHPADLGSVLVRMRLQDGRLEMSLRTSREETAERLRKEGELLAGLLREAGYEPDTVTIQAGGAGPGDPGTRGQGFASAGSQGGQHDRQPGAATPDQSGRRPSPRADEAATPTEEQDHETDSRRRDHGGLYL